MGTVSDVYDRIGSSYSRTRREDPRIAAQIVDALGDARTVPDDCIDGFGAAFWSRPEAYLDPEVQAGMSWLALLPDGVRARGAARLREELESGEGTGATATSEASGTPRARLG